jgi:hypothetical protein
MNGAGYDPRHALVLLSSRVMDTLPGDMPGIIACDGAGRSGHGAGVSNACCEPAGSQARESARYGCSGWPRWKHNSPVTRVEKKTHSWFTSTRRVVLPTCRTGQSAAGRETVRRKCCAVRTHARPGISRRAWVCAVQVKGLAGYPHRDSNTTRFISILPLRTIAPGVEFDTELIDP